MPRARKNASAPETPPDTSALAAEAVDFQSDSLGYSLRRAQLRAYDLFFEMMSDMDLSPARLTALSLIAMEPEMDQATLARRLEVAGPSVLKMIDALEGAGFIRRMPVPGDRRRHSLMLTTPGRATLQTLHERVAAYEARLAQALSAAERRKLIALLDRVAPPGAA